MKKWTYYIKISSHKKLGQIYIEYMPNVVKQYKTYTKTLHKYKAKVHMIRDKQIPKTEKEIEELKIKIIQKGSDSELLDKNLNNKFKVFNIRIPYDLYEDLERAVKNRVGISKTGWILECISERLKTL